MRVEGTQVLTRYGKVGANGQTTVKDEGSADGAQKLHDTLVREKTGKGYVEKAATGPTPTAPVVKAAPPPPPAADPPRTMIVIEPGFRRFEATEGGSSKFWEVKVEGEQQIVRFGRIGTDGPTPTWSTPTGDASVMAAADALIKKNHAHFFGALSSFEEGDENELELVWHYGFIKSATMSWARPQRQFLELGEDFCETGDWDISGTRTGKLSALQLAREVNFGKSQDPDRAADDSYRYVSVGE